VLYEREKKVALVSWSLKNTTYLGLTHLMPWDKALPFTYFSSSLLEKKIYNFSWIELNPIWVCFWYRNVMKLSSCKHRIVQQTFLSIHPLIWECYPKPSFSRKVTLIQQCEFETSMQSDFSMILGHR
jgi:hypothetical protein